MKRKFEWDEGKNEINRHKHYLDFSDITEVFDDDNRVTSASNRDDERRYLTIGKALGLILTVVYTMRNVTYRIISARPSRKDERKRYLASTV